MTNNKKNSVHTMARFLLDIISSPGSSAYKGLRAMCWDNDLQSDNSAEDLRREFESDLRRLLIGDYETVTEKMTRHAPPPPPIVIHRKARTGEKVRIGDSDVYIETALINGATPHQFLYGSLRRCIDSRDIAYLALCRKCRKIFYRRSLKREFCSDECRWSYFNGGQDRKAKRRKGGEWYLHNQGGLNQSAQSRKKGPAVSD